MIAAALGTALILGAPLAANVPKADPDVSLHRPMLRPVQWEYTVFEAYGINAGPTQEFLGLRSEPTAKYLNRLGLEGWELVSVTRAAEGERVYFFMKRAIPAP